MESCLPTPGSGSLQTKQGPGIPEEMLCGEEVQTVVLHERPGAQTERRFSRVRACRLPQLRDQRAVGHRTTPTVHKSLLSARTIRQSDPIWRSELRVSQAQSGDEESQSRFGWRDGDAVDSGSEPAASESHVRKGHGARRGYGIDDEDVRSLVLVVVLGLAERRVRGPALPLSHAAGPADSSSSPALERQSNGGS
jgi:hypothetical protein